MVSIADESEVRGSATCAVPATVSLNRDFAMLHAQWFAGPNYTFVGTEDDVTAVSDGPITSETVFFSLPAKPTLLDLPTLDLAVWMKRSPKHGYWSQVLLRFGQDADPTTTVLTLNISRTMQDVKLSLPGPSTRFEAEDTEFAVRVLSALREQTSRIGKPRVFRALVNSEYK